MNISSYNIVIFIFIDSRLRQVFENIFYKSLNLQDANPSSSENVLKILYQIMNLLINL